MKNSLIQLAVIGVCVGLSIRPTVAKPGENYHQLEQFSSLPIALKTVASAMESNKSDRLFRVSWANDAPSSRGHEVVLYDRSRRTLKYYSWADSLVSEEKPIRRLTSESMLYRGVSDRIIRRLLDYKPKDGYGFSTDEALEQLVRLGSKKQTLAKKSHQYTAK